MDEYYQEKQYVALVNQDDQIIGQAEKWQAHKENLLHRGFTLILTHQGQTIFQHRKHPVFDSYYDMSFSSHPLLRNNKIQSLEEAMADGLLREWQLKMSDLVTLPKLITKIYYQATDPQSHYSEHEIDYIYQAELKQLPEFNPQFAYGYTLTRTEPLAPWVKLILEKIRKA